MNKFVPSTFRILKEKAFNADIDERWADWAIEMMQAGFEVESLYELAGISKPFNQFVLQELTNSVLKDLQLDYSDKEKTIKDYANYIIKTNLENPRKHFDVLKELLEIYYELDMDVAYQDFALLYWAKEDLIDREVQWYWDNADRTNIDKIIKDHFVLWLNKVSN